MSGKEFTIVRTFDATQEATWHAWTDANVAAQWWHPNGLEVRPGSVTIDLREGGAFAYTMIDSDGIPYPWAGAYIDVRPMDHLRFTWGRAGAGESLLITVDLADAGHGRTTMTFHVDGVTGEFSDGEVYHGWDQAFDILARRLAQEDYAR